MRRISYPMVALAALAACSSGGAASQEAEGQPAAAGEAADESDAPVLTAEGYGPLRIGMTLDEVTAALGPDADPEAVGGPEPEVCDEFRPERAPLGMYVMIENGRLARITLSEGADVETDAGLSVGSPASAVLEAYGDRIESMPHHYSPPPAKYLTVWASGRPGQPYVDDPDARGIRYETDEAGNVMYIHAGGPAIQYVEGCL